MSHSFLISFLFFFSFFFLFQTHEENICTCKPMKVSSNFLQMMQMTYLLLIFTTVCIQLPFFPFSSFFCFYCFLFIPFVPSFSLILLFLIILTSILAMEFGRFNGILNFFSFGFFGRILHFENFQLLSFKF